MSNTSPLPSLLKKLSISAHSTKTSNTIPLPPVLQNMCTKPATTFSLFPTLAPELRLKIWAHACLPRTVSIRYLPSTDTCISSTPPPTILHVSHEARAEALLIYSLAFGTRSSPARTYFNPYRDTLYLPRHMAMGYDETLRDFRTLVLDTEGVLEDVRSVAVDHVDVEVKRPWESYNKASFVRGFGNVEEVVLVLCQSDGENAWGDVRFVQPRERVEEVVRFWVEFRQGFALEERRREDVCREVERKYEKFVLPNVRIRDKVLV